jgi:SAM-dependent methyltransferase
VDQDQTDQDNSTKLDAFIRIYEAGNPKPYRNYAYQMSRMFRGIDLSGKLILDVGCGLGYLSQYLAVTAPTAKIIAMDEAEGDGSSKEVLRILEENNRTIGIDNLEIVKADFNNWEPKERFDLVVAKNAIHHLPWKVPLTRESDAFIHRNQEVHDNFLETFQRLRSFLKPGGHLVFGDVSRMNVYRLMPLSIRKKFRTVNWRIKPTKGEWLYLMRKTGFTHTGYRCDVPFKLRSLTPVWRPLKAYFFFPDFYFFGTNPE